MFPSFISTGHVILCYSGKEHIVPELILVFRSVCHLQGEYSALWTSVALHVFTTCVGPILFVFRWCFTLSGLTYLSGKTLLGNRLIPQTALECFHRMAPGPSNTSFVQTLSNCPCGNQANIYWIYLPGSCMFMESCFSFFTTDYISTHCIFLFLLICRSGAWCLKSEYCRYFHYIPSRLVSTHCAFNLIQV